MNQVMRVCQAVALLMFAQTAMADPGVTGKRSQLSISLSGGLATIHGGDLNRMIEDWHSLLAGPDYEALSPSIEWPEFKSVPALGAEVSYHLSARFALCLGFEVLKKRIPGRILLTWGPETTEWNDDFYFYHAELREESMFEPVNSLTAFPLTLSAAYFVPVGRRLRLFTKAGLGYCFATLRSTYLRTEEIRSRTDRYDWPDGGLSDVHHFVQTVSGTVFDKADTGAFGFHMGAGMEIDVTSHLALIFEGLYRKADLKGWEGTESAVWSYHSSSGWESVGFEQIDDEAEYPPFPGDLRYMVIDGEPLVLISSGEPGLYDVGPAVIKLGGFSFRAGFKLRF